MSDTTALPTDQDAVLRFRDGIPGFPDSHRFMLTDLGEDSAFQVLQSLDQEDVSLVVSVPWLFFPDYAPELSEEDRRDLGIDAPEDAVIFCPVTLGAEPETVYMNLLGPFLVNAETREGRQVALADASLPVRAPVRLGG